MSLHLTNLKDDDAAELLAELLIQLFDTRQAVEHSQRQAIGIRKMIDGLVEMFPALEDLLPEDLDDDEDPRPRGTEAIRRVLAENKGAWYTVPAIVTLLDAQDWLPNSSNPANAVRTALERLVERKVVEKSRSTEGVVIYRHPPPPTSYRSDEEPF